MKIYVRRRHIREGKPRAGAYCPIALAFEEITGERPWVDNVVVFANRDMFELPRSAQRFIVNFDSGKPVKPFAFVLK